MSRTKFASQADYIQAASEQAQPILLRIQSLIQSTVPDATACISYNIPAFKVNKPFIYFAAFKKHIGIYPPVADDETLIKELTPYRNEKGNIAFPLRQAIPYDMVIRVAHALHMQNMSSKL